MSEGYYFTAFHQFNEYVFYPYMKNTGELFKKTKKLMYEK